MHFFEKSNKNYKTHQRQSTQNICLSVIVQEWLNENLVDQRKDHCLMLRSKFNDLFSYFCLPPDFSCPSLVICRSKRLKKNPPFHLCILTFLLPCNYFINNYQGIKKFTTLQNGIQSIQFFYQDIKNDNAICSESCLSELRVQNIRGDSSCKLVPAKAKTPYPVIK